MDKINEIKNQYRQTCDDILQKKDSFEKKDLDTVENIILNDNTEPKVVLCYLKLIQKFRNKDFLYEIEKYKYFLSKEVINKEFSKLYQKNMSSSNMFHELFQKILNYSDSMNSIDKIHFYNKLVSIDSGYDNIKGFINYKTNKELTIYILVINIKKGIAKYVNKIKNYEINNNDPIIKYQQEMLKESQIFKKVENYLSNKAFEIPTNKEIEIHKKIKQFNKNYNINNINEIIEQLKEQIILESKINSNTFSKYFENFSEFLGLIKTNFDIKFNNIESLENNEFELFMYFCFFITYYDFETIYFYSDKWNNTLSQSKEYIEKILNQNSITNVNKYKLENNNLILEVYKHFEKKIIIKEIKNIHKYCIDCIIGYFSNNYIKKPVNDELNVYNISNYSKQKSIINEYNIEKYLKFDIEEIYINRIWEILEKHLIKIFTSKAIKSAVKEMYEKLNINNYYDFLNEKDLKILLKRSRFFGFQTNFFGITEPLLLIDYIYYGGINKSDFEVLSKLLDLSIYQVTQEHEILGYMNIRMQKYIFRKEISSPNFFYLDNNGVNINKTESGDFMEILLYGRCITQLTYKEILFLLDEDNYDVMFDVFRINFIKCQVGPYRISESLSKFLKSLCINAHDEYNNLGPLTINQNVFGKALPNNVLVLNQGRKSHNDYFHPPKVSKSVRNVIDEMYIKLFELFKPTIK